MIKDVLITKKAALNTYKEKLEIILVQASKLKDDERKSLPKFNGEFQQDKLEAYLQYLDKASKDPIRFQRKNSLSKLKINVDKIKEELLDDNQIDEIVNILTELSKQNGTYPIIAEKISVSILQQSFADVCNWLKIVQKELTQVVTQLSQLKSEDTREFLFRGYIGGNNGFAETYKYCVSVSKLEGALNLKVTKEDLILVDEVNKLLEKFGAFNKQRNESYNSLKQAKEILTKDIEQLERQYQAIIKEIGYWKLIYDVFLPDTKDINLLTEKVSEIKGKCAENYKSFKLLEQVFTKGLYDNIDLKVLSNQVETVNNYIKDIEIGSAGDIEKIQKVYACKSQLENIGYPETTSLLQAYDYMHVEDLFSKSGVILDEYNKLIKECQLFCKILEQKDEIPGNYLQLKDKADNLKSELINDIGKDFEVLIEFLKSDAEDVNIDKKTLENFIKRMRPLIREAIRL